MTGSEVELLHVTARRAAIVVAVVSKIDVHRVGRDVLVANRARYPVVDWMGVAAAPEIGVERVDELVDALNASVPWEGGRPAPAVSRRRSGTSESAGRRSHVQQARIHLNAQARAVCAAMRAELHESAAEMPLRRVETFRREACSRAAQAVEDLDRTVTRRLAEVGDACGLESDFGLPADGVPVLVFPSIRSPDLENRLTALLATGFGIGAAVTCSRLLEGVVPVFSDTPASGAISAVAGAVLGSWLGYTRRVLSARASMDRWIDEVAAMLRTTLEERITARVLTAEIGVDAPRPKRAGGRSESFAFHRVGYQR